MNKNIFTVVSTAIVMLMGSIFFTFKSDAMSPITPSPITSYPSIETPHNGCQYVVVKAVNETNLQYLVRAKVYSKGKVISVSDIDALGNNNSIDISVHIPSKYVDEYLIMELETSYTVGGPINIAVINGIAIVR